MKNKKSKWQQVLTCAGIAWITTTGTVWAQTTSTELWVDTVDLNGNVTESWGRKAILGEGFVPKAVTNLNPVTVYVLDGGVGKHQYLGNVTARLSAVAGGTGVGCWAHATHIAGIIGAQGGAPGIYPGVEIVSVGWTGRNGAEDCDEGTPSFEAAAAKIKKLIIAKGQVGIVSISSNPWKDGTPNTTLQADLNDEINELLTPKMTPEGYYPGAFVVQSAGNYYRDACETTYYRPDDKKIRPTPIPADSDGFMTVGVLDRYGHPALEYELLTKEGILGNAGINPVEVSGSNFGPCVDVWAPGHEIYSTWGGNYDSNSGQKSTETYSGFRKLSGTSMAAPHIAALAAYLVDTAPEGIVFSTPGDIEQAVRGNLGLGVRQLELGSKDKSGQNVWMPTLDTGDKRANPNAIFALIDPRGKAYIAGQHIEIDLSSDDFASFQRLKFRSAGTRGCSINATKVNNPNWNDSLLPPPNIVSYDWNVTGIRVGDSGIYIWTAECSSESGKVQTASFRLNVGMESSSPVCETITPPASIPYDGGYHSITATCTGNPTIYHWEIDGAPFETTNNTIGYTFPRNDGNTQISFVITVQAENGAGIGNQIETTVTQATAKPACTITPSTTLIPYTGGKQWVSASCSNLPASHTFRWIVNGLEQGETGKQLDYNFPPNTGTAPIGFNVSVEVMSGGVPISDPAQTTVTQAAKAVCTLTPSISQIPAAGGYYTVTAACNGSPTLYYWVVNGYEQGSTGNSIGYTFPANTSTTPINIAISMQPRTNGVAAGDTVSVTVPQAGALLPKPVCTITPSTTSIPASGGYYTTTASCTGSPASYRWVVNGYVQGTTGNVLGYTFPANTTNAPIDFSITVQATNSAGTGDAAQVKVTQQAPKPVCTITPSIGTIPATGGSYSATASCTGLPTTYRWVVNGYVQGTSGNVVSYNFPANTSTAQINWNVSVQASNASGMGDLAQKSIPQAGMVPPPVCTITPSIGTIPANGGYYTATASCTGSPYTYRWVVNGYVQGSTGNSIGYNFPANTSTAPINWNVSVQATNSAGMGNAAQTAIPQAGKPASPPAIALYVNGVNRTNSSVSVPKGVGFTFTYTAINATSCSMVIRKGGAVWQSLAGQPGSGMSYPNTILYDAGSYSDTVTCVNAQGQSSSAYTNFTVY